MDPFPSLRFSPLLLPLPSLPLLYSLPLPFSPFPYLLFYRLFSPPLSHLFYPYDSFSLHCRWIMDTRHNLSFPCLVPSCCLFRIYDHLLYFLPTFRLHPPHLYSAFYIRYIVTSFTFISQYCANSSIPLLIELFLLHCLVSSKGYIPTYPLPSPLLLVSFSDFITSYFPYFYFR